MFPSSLNYTMFYVEVFVLCLCEYARAPARVGLVAPIDVVVPP